MQTFYSRCHRDYMQFNNFWCSFSSPYSFITFIHLENIKQQDCGDDSGVPRRHNCWLLLKWNQNSLIVVIWLSGNSNSQRRDHPCIMAYVFSDNRGHGKRGLAIHRDSEAACKSCFLYTDQTPFNILASPITTSKAELSFSYPENSALIYKFLLTCVK